MIPRRRSDWLNRLHLSSFCKLSSMSDWSKAYQISLHYLSVLSSITDVSEKTEPVSCLKQTDSPPAPSRRSRRLSWNAWKGSKSFGFFSSARFMAFMDPDLSKGSLFSPRRWIATRLQQTPSQCHTLLQENTQESERVNIQSQCH